ncbi:putative RNA methyltransferase [Corynebacterium ciconiae DSM 44920]|uniref:class I SAM-dependent RNA methyltransferase n=1 Tax=Corynebacterium ciconiae TaxID=227319 RepID=UPI00036551EC|nr:TRAM domain-containing protein [Corynebacterium ciconiae]WKD61362.1 putative RNA methyltransferase [Corynebacterium ciconiae DSM 44920]
MLDVKKGARVRVQVLRMAHGGEAIAQLSDADEDQRIVFVRDGVIGDELEVELVQVKKRFMRARLVRVITPGPHRVEPRCPAVAHGSGCCDFAHLDPAIEAETKTGIVVEQLRRLGKLDAPEHLTTIDLGMDTGWRTRARVGVDRRGRIGMRRRGSHKVVHEPLCSAWAQPLIDAVSTLSPPRAKEVSVCLDTEGCVHAMAGGQVLLGSGRAREQVGGRSFELPADAFWQAHQRAPEAYQRIIAEALADIDGDVGWDLYGGVGLFVDPVRGDRGREVHSVELAEHGAECGRRAFAGESGVHFHRMDCAEAIFTEGLLPDPDVVVLDPPRVGADAAVIAGTAARRPRAVVHIGCDPATFARDLARWVEHGYCLAQLTVVDAFPGSHHCESIALLRAR